MPFPPFSLLTRGARLDINHHFSELSPEVEFFRDYIASVINPEINDDKLKPVESIYRIAGFFIHLANGSGGVLSRRDAIECEGIFKGYQDKGVTFQNPNLINADFLSTKITSLGPHTAKQIETLAQEITQSK